MIRTDGEMRKMVKMLKMSNVVKVGKVSGLKEIGKIGLVIGLVMILLASPALASKFPDIKDHWGQSYIQWGVNEGLVVGYEDGTFQPNKSLSEAEFATLLTKFASNTNEAGAVSSHWSDPYYTAMQNFNLPFKGYNNLEVRNQPVNRGTIAQIVASKNGFDLPLALAIQYMYDNELSQGLDANVQNFDTYGADKSLTRAEAVTFLERLNSIEATSFMGIPSPTTDGRKVLTDAERDKIREEVKQKSKEWLTQFGSSVPEDQRDEINDWLYDRNQERTDEMTGIKDLNSHGLPTMSMEMMTNPLVQKAMSQMGTYDQAKTNTYCICYFNSGPFSVEISAENGATILILPQKL